MGMPGSQRNVQRLVDEHYAALYRYAFRLAGSATDADDLTQEAFCKAQLSLGQLRDPSRSKPWLFSILRNAYLHRIRAERQARCIPLDGAPDIADPSSESDVAPEIDPQRLQEALAELPEGFRSPVILYYFEDFSYRDIAEQMDLPIGTVMSRLARAKGHLRTRLLAPAPAEILPGTQERRAPNGL
jgi:RNA polymerase sigma-70 factor (ECF subfamily)